MAPNHPYLSLRLPEDSPFELKPSPGKGWGAFATRDIKKDTRILVEDPLFVICKPVGTATDSDVKRALDHLPTAGKRQFQYLHSGCTLPFLSEMHILAGNACDLTTRGRGPAHGLFILVARFNHSCVPNSVVQDLDRFAQDTHGGASNLSRTAHIVWAIKDIPAGEEITHCYGPDFMMRRASDRKRHLLFTCDCAACVVGTTRYQLSEIRRTFIRALSFLCLGRDQADCDHSPFPGFVIDPTLKKQAETFRIPLSNRLIYGLLKLLLTDEEGLLDVFMRIKMWRTTVEEVAGWFKTESNIEIVRRALAQETWLGKVTVAFELYGRPDAADDEITEGFQKLTEEEIRRAMSD